MNAEAVNSVELPQELAQFEERIALLNSEIKKFQFVIEEEILKYKRYQVTKCFIRKKLLGEVFNFSIFFCKIENVRRRHNYIPFICELLKLAAKKGKFEELVTDAKKRQQERREKKKEQEKEKEQNK